MLFWRRVWIAWLVACLWGTASGQAQANPQAMQTISADTEAELQAMSRLAGVIFAGQVIAVRRYEAVNGATGVVEIEFAVDDAVRGVSGPTYTLREWAGLWTAGSDLFRVGERFLMLLHAPGPAGLSSPVGGSDGAIPIRGGLAYADGLYAATDTRAVDVRWITTRVVRSVSYRAVPVAADGNATRVELDAPVQPAEAAADTAAYATALASLRRWERAAHAAR